MGQGTLVGSNYGNNVIRMAPGNAAVGGQYDNTFYLAGSPTVTGGAGNNTYHYDAGDGAATILPNGSGTIQLGTGISASGLSFQDNDATGDLTISVGTAGDSITLKGDLGRGWWGGPTSKVGQLTFSDGSTFRLNQKAWWDDSLLNFTWTGTAANTMLVGSNYGDNTFVLGAGGDTIVGGQYGNTYLYGKGDGAATITLNGSSTLKLGAGIGASDLTFQANDATGDLIILDGAAGDSITLKGDLARGWWGGSTSKVGQLTFTDGSTLQLGQKGWWDSSLLNFTWTGKAENTVLVGSSYGNNTFVLGAGNNQVIFGNGNQGGSQSNTVVFGSGDGQATVNPNGASGRIQLAAGIAFSDVALSHDPQGDFVLALKGTGDSLTIIGGNAAAVQGIAFADGTTWNTRFGGSGNDRLYGAGGPTIFDGRGGSDYEQGSAGDTFLFDPGYGHLEVNETDDDASRVSTLQFGAGILPSQVSLNGNAADWNLTATIGGVSSGDAVVLDSQLLSSRYGVQQIKFADGTAWDRAEIVRQTGLGMPGKPVLYGSSGDDLFAPKGQAHEIWGYGGSDTYLVDRGDGAVAIHNAYHSSSPHGHLAFAATVTPDQLWFAQSGNDLVATILGTADAATIKDWFANSGAPTADIQAAGGGARLDSGLGQLVSSMASYQAANSGFTPATTAAMPNDPSLRSAIAAAWHG